MRGWFVRRRYRRWHRRGFGNDPVRGTTAVLVRDHAGWIGRPPPPEAAFPGVTVIDGTAFDLADRVCARLRESGHGVRVTSPYHLASAEGGAMLLLPLRAAAAPTATREITTVLAAVARAGTTLPGPTTLVWCVDHATRRTAAVVGGPGGLTNHAALFLGNSWTRDVSRAGGTAAAVRERHARIARILRAPSHDHIGDLSTTGLLNHLTTVSPTLTHALIVEAANGTWTGLPSLPPTIRTPP